MRYLDFLDWKFWIWGLIYGSLGFDASAHLSEETKNASWSAPLGVIMSVGVSSIFGFFVLLAYVCGLSSFILMAR